MNRPIRRVAVFVGVMMAALLLNISYLSIARTQALNEDLRNRRVRDAEFAQDRGSIMVGNTPVANTVPASGQFKYKRVYTQGSLYAPVTGYYSYDYGRSALEQQYNQELSGTADSQLFTRLSDLFTGKTPTGADVQTTINAKAQKAAAQALGNQQGAVVAINYKTGAILALVTSPSYDPNQLSSTELSSARAAWQRLTKDKTYPMSNRATREIFPPGSTFKLITAAAALENGMQPDSQVASPAQLKLPTTNTYLGNDSNCGGDKTTIDHALVVSCNTAFANLGLQLGADKLRAQAQKFGFDSSFSTDVNSVTSHFPAKPDQPQTAMSAIGQFEVAATPLQMAVVAAGIANDGQVMEPYLVQEVRSADLQVLSSHQPNVMRRAMSAENAQKLQQMMTHVVQSGTGTRAQIGGLTIGGKTGTAQSDKKRAPYAWFTGFSKEQSVAICVFVQSTNMSATDVAGGVVAAPIFRAVVEALR